MVRINTTHARLMERCTADILRDYEAATGRPLSPPIPIFDIVRRLFALRCDVENLRGSLADASGVLMPEKGWIILNKRQPSTRLNFSLAHELGHWLIDCQPSEPSRTVDYVARLRCNEHRMRERTANYFAGALLMPKHMLVKEISESYAPADPDESGLARTFGVSESALKARLRILRHELRGWASRLLPPEMPCRDAPGFGFRSANTELQRPRVAMVKVECPVIDHELYRRLRSLRSSCRYLLLVSNGQDDPSDGWVENLDCVDGLVSLEGAQFDNLEKLTSDCPDADILVRRVVGGTWLERLAREGVGTGLKGKSAYVVIVRSDDQNQLVRRPLLDIESYIVPAVPLEYRRHARTFVANAKKDGKRVVVVTGCFDLLTKEHVRFLKGAKEAGDVLVVGVEDDTRVRAFKGLFRPANTVSQRVEVLSAVRFVDFVFVISGSPRLPLKPFYSRLHKTIRADVLAVTEGDPHLDDRRDEIEAAGGKLLVTRRLGDGSSTSLLARLLAPTEYSDLTLVSKAKPRPHEADHHGNWRQLSLSIEGFE
jgi:cytidyltransferase-like protein